jgi:hypothetical protein
VVRAALAPADPSPQDRAVAGQATAIEQQAKQELSAEKSSTGNTENQTGAASGNTKKPVNPYNVSNKNQVGSGEPQIISIYAWGIWFPFFTFASALSDIYTFLLMHIQLGVDCFYKLIFCQRHRRFLSGSWVSVTGYTCKGILPFDHLDMTIFNVTQLDILWTFTVSPEQDDAENNQHDCYQHRIPENSLSQL